MFVICSLNNTRIKIGINIKTNFAVSLYRYARYPIISHRTLHVWRENDVTESLSRELRMREKVPKNECFCFKTCFKLYLRMFFCKIWILLIGFFAMTRLVSKLLFIAALFCRSDTAHITERPGGVVVGSCSRSESTV